MSGDIHTSYDRGSSGNAPKRRSWPAMVFVAACAGIPCAALYADHVLDDYRNLWARGYSGVSFSADASGLCGPYYPVARAFTAQNRKGAVREGTYCASDFFGYKLMVGTDLAEAAPPTP